MPDMVLIVKCRTELGITKTEINVSEQVPNYEGATKGNI